MVFTICKYLFLFNIATLKHFQNLFQNIFIYRNNSYYMIIELKRKFRGAMTKVFQWRYLPELKLKKTYNWNFYLYAQ